MGDLVAVKKITYLCTERLLETKSTANCLSHGREVKLRFLDAWQQAYPRHLGELTTFRKWEHRMIQWMEAYQARLTAKDAQLKLRVQRQYKTAFQKR